MGEFRRSHRIVLMTKELTDNPQRNIPLSSFSERFGTAKSTISEDLSIIRETLEEARQGHVETFSGAIGGVRFVPMLAQEGVRQLSADLCERLSDSRRILPGGFLYMTDLVFSPDLCKRIGLAFATAFYEARPTHVVTVETKGVPLATMTAEALGVPLVIIRREHKVTEGPALSINYVSGSSRRISTMHLARRSLSAGARALLVDDFLKGGGTAGGMTNLMKEFEATVVGFCTLVETSDERKPVADWRSLVRLTMVDEVAMTVDVEPGSLVHGYCTTHTL